MIRHSLVKSLHTVSSALITAFVVISVLTAPVLLSSCGESISDPVVGDRYFLDTIYTWNGTDWSPLSPSSSNITAAGPIADNSVVRGDGGGNGIQGSLATLNDFGTFYTPSDINTDSDVNAGNDVNVTNDLEVTSQADIGGQLTVDDQIHITGNYPLKWMDMTDTTTYAYIHHDGNLYVVDNGGGNLILDADTGNITADSYIELRGDGRVYNTEWIDAGGIRAPGSKPATEVAHGLLETDAWQFADAITGNENTVSFEIKAHYSMDRSEEATISLGWSSSVTSSNCTWQLEYRWIALGEDTTTGADETLTVTTLSSTTANGLTMTTFTGMNLPESNDIGIFCRVTRKSGSLTDTIVGTVELHGLFYQWVSNNLGGEL